MITSSLHNHCNFCDGKDTPEEMFAAAVEAGITDFGFSCHSYNASEPSETLKNEKEYIDKINAMKRINDTPARLYLGAEEDLFFPVTYRHKYDYIIGSAHYVEADGKYYAVDTDPFITKKCVKEAFGGNGLAYADAYFKNVLAAAKKKPDILGHFDLIRLCGADVLDFNGKAYRELAEFYLDECVKTGVIFELNVGAAVRKKLSSPYPDLFLLRRLLEKGGRVTVSTDCHDKRVIAKGLSAGGEYLKNIGFKTVAVMKNGKFVEELL